MTCNPCNPVAAKKVEPYIPSEISKGDSSYSKYCKTINIPPKCIVFKVYSLLLWIKPSCKRNEL